MSYRVSLRESTEPGATTYPTWIIQEFWMVELSWVIHLSRYILLLETYDLCGSVHWSLDDISYVWSFSRIPLLSSYCEGCQTWHLENHDFFSLEHLPCWRGVHDDLAAICIVFRSFLSLRPLRVGHFGDGRGWCFQTGGNTQPFEFVFCFFLYKYSKVVSTHLLEHTQSNLYQRAIKRFLSWWARGIAWGVLHGCVVIFLENHLAFHQPW